MSRDSAAFCCAVVVTANVPTTAMTAATVRCHVLMSPLLRAFHRGIRRTCQAPYGCATLRATPLQVGFRYQVSWRIDDVARVPDVAPRRTARTALHRLRSGGYPQRHHRR